RPWSGTSNSFTAPDGVMRPILFTEDSVNQTLPSGPAVMKSGKLAGVGTGNSRTTGPVSVLNRLRSSKTSNHSFVRGLSLRRGAARVDDKTRRDKRHML